METENLEYCCDEMRYFATYRCNQHLNPFECPDNLIRRDAISGEYGLIVHDGGSSYIAIAFCPWCGKSLPSAHQTSKK
jgi:hypothetical protein